NGNTVGGTTTADRNVISGNTGTGVQISGNAADNNVVSGNFIGTNVAGTAAIANGLGVSIDSSADTNTVGGTAMGAGNIISGNSSDGVRIDGAGTGNKVQGNFIGTDVNGTADLGNTKHGVDVIDTDQVTIGGTVTNAGNVISGNDGNGVEISGTS